MLETPQSKRWRQFSLGSLILICTILGAAGGICGPSIYERLTVERPKPPKPVQRSAQPTAARRAIPSRPKYKQLIRVKVEQPQRELTPGELRRRPIHGLPIYFPPNPVEQGWADNDSTDGRRIDR